MEEWKAQCDACDWFEYYDEENSFNDDPEESANKAIRGHVGGSELCTFDDVSIWKVLSRSDK